MRHYKVTKNRRRTVRAIILRCPDRRLLDAHRGFIEKELKLRGGEYYSLKRAGGAISLARGGELPDGFKDLISEIQMFLSLHPEIGHVIIINHEDCKKYDSVVDRKKSPPKPEREDLLRAAQTLTHKFHGLQIGAYYAAFTDGRKRSWVFETVFETDKKASLRA